MEINVSWEEMRKRSLFVGVPMYGGACHGGFASSMMSLSVECARAGIDLQFYTLHNESLITRGRTYICDEFMRSGKTNLMFIDSDIAFNPRDVFTLLALQDPFDLANNEYDVVSAPYPKKSISWEKIKQAVDSGFAEKDPNQLERYVGDFVFNPRSGTTQINLGEPCEIREAGTGFMMIRRNTLEKYQEAYPELMYRPDHARTAHFDGTREICLFFDCIIENKYSNLREELAAYLAAHPDATAFDLKDWLLDPSQAFGEYSKRYLSEDYQFSHTVQKVDMGNGRKGKIWMCPWMELKHIGTYVFGGSIIDLAQLGASLTVDPTKIIKK